MRKFLMSRTLSTEKLQNHVQCPLHQCPAPVGACVEASVYVCVHNMQIQLTNVLEYYEHFSIVLYLKLICLFDRKILIAIEHCRNDCCSGSYSTLSVNLIMTVDPKETLRS